MVIKVLLLILGFALLIKGADWIIAGASSLAQRFKVSDLAIGLTIVAFGTSMPEFVVNSIAAYQNQPDIVFGNIIGSNNFNLYVILGISGLVSPLVVQSSTVWKEIPLSFFAVLMLFMLSNGILVTSEVLSIVDGIILLICFFFFLIYVFRQLKTDNSRQEIARGQISTGMTWAYVAFGLAFLVIGGRFVVMNSIEIAQSLGLSQRVIGLTLVAAGTSLPELATSVIATIKKNNDIAVGNIIGSNVFNIFFILGVSALIRPIHYDVQFNHALYLLGAGTLLLFIAMFSGKKRKLDRWESGILLLIYIAYTTYLII